MGPSPLYVFTHCCVDHITAHGTCFVSPARRSDLNPIRSVSHPYVLMIMPPSCRCKLASSCATQAGTNVTPPPHMLPHTQLPNTHFIYTCRPPFAVDCLVTWITLAYLVWLPAASLTAAVLGWLPDMSTPTCLHGCLCYGCDCVLPPDVRCCMSANAMLLQYPSGRCTA